MGDNRARCRRRAALTVAAVVVATVLTACAAVGNYSADDAGASTTSASSGGVQPGAQQVCAEFATVALSSDTTVDRDPAAARTRAADFYGTEALRRSLTGAGIDHDWAELAAHHARIAVITDPILDDPPPATADRAAAGVEATATAVGADGWRRDLPSVAVYCTLQRVGAAWRVDDVQLSDAGGVR
jgi:hypothetical protein